MVLSVVAMADEDGIEEGQKLCQGLSFPSEKQSCLELISGFKYLDKNAVSICESQSFTSQKIECLGVIKDKKYTQTLVNTCKEMSFPSQIISCLKKTGNAYTAPAVISQKPYGKAEMRRELTRALTEMEKGQIGEVRRIILQALEYLND